MDQTRYTECSAKRDVLDTGVLAVEREDGSASRVLLVVDPRVIKANAVCKEARQISETSESKTRRTSATIFARSGLINRRAHTLGLVEVCQRSLDVL